MTEAPNSRLSGPARRRPLSLRVMRTAKGRDRVGLQRAAFETVLAVQVLQLGVLWMSAKEMPLVALWRESVTWLVGGGRGLHE
jgi:hypothetical protein